MLICDENGFRLRAFISKPVAGAERRCLAFALEPSLALGSRLKIESNENMHKKKIKIKNNSRPVSYTQLTLPTTDLD